jgi:beta-lactamase regulating signal transducer with metallopeptidase domain
MRLLETWVATPLAQAVGWTLLHSLWEGAIISAGLAVALLPMRSARARYAAACVAMLVMLGGIGFTLVRVMPEGMHGLRTVGTPAFSAWNVPPDMDAAGPSNPGLAAVVPWFAPFWIVGVWIFALGHLAGWISVCRLRRRGVCCAPEGWQKELVRLSAQLRVSRPILLLESCLAEVPMVVGHIRPAILMPLGLLAGLPAGQIEAILLHELAHIRRYDYLVNAWQRAVECLLFYHPAAWWISRVIRAERENCCDDVVVAESGKVQEYAVALAALEHNRCSGRPAAVAGTGGNLMKRIRRLLYPKRANGVWTPVVAAVILMTTAVVALAAWPAKPPQQSSAVAPQLEEPKIAPGTVQLKPFLTAPQLVAPQLEEPKIAPGIVQLKPFPTEPVAHLRLDADSRRVFATIAGLAHLNVAFTSDFEGRPLSVDLTNVTIEEALRVVSHKTNSFWKPLTSDTILIVPENQNYRREYILREYLDRPETSSYDRWLNQEVVYIIGDEERSAFQELTTDE